MVVLIGRLPQGDYSRLALDAHGEDEERINSVDLGAVHAIAVNRLDGITASGSAGRRVALANGRICIGHPFLTRYSSHAICVPITQRLSAGSGDHLSRFRAPSLYLFLFLSTLSPFLFFLSSPPRLHPSLSFNLFCTSTRRTRRNLSRRPDGFSAIFRSAAAVTGQQLPRPVMDIRTFAPRPPAIIHEELKVVA